MKPIILVPLVALVLVGGSAGAYLAVTSEGSVEEAVIAQATPTPAPAAETPTPTPTQVPGGAGGGGEGTLVPILTPFPSLPPVPDDWPTYTEPQGFFSIRYPPTWSAKGGSLWSFDTSSFDPDTGVGPRPPDLIEVEMGYYDAAGSSGCGGLERVPGTVGSGDASDFARAPTVAPATLGGVPGGQLIRVFDPPEGDLIRIHGISVIHKGYCFNFAAYFAQENPDQETFLTDEETFLTILQIASSFKFGDFPAIDQMP
jgi:hypothetical protein